MKHTNASILQLAGPADVRRLVEPRHQLDHHSYILALSRLYQRPKHRRIRARPVKRLLDRDHRRIFRGSLDKPFNRLIALERMMQQHIPLPQLREDVLGLLPQLVLPRLEHRILQRRPIRLRVQVHQPRQVYRTIGLHHLPRIELEVRPQTLDDLRQRSALDLQPDRIAFPPVMQFRAHALQHRARFLLLHIQVAVPRHPKRRASQNLVSAEHPLNLALDQLMQQDVVERSAISLNRRQSHQPRAATEERSQRPASSPHCLCACAAASSAMHRALFRTLGNGCDGSIVTGVSRGSASLS